MSGVANRFEVQKTEKILIRIGLTMKQNEQESAAYLVDVLLVR
jgi:hypothetical protein